MKSYLQLLIEYIEQSKPMDSSETRIWYKAMMYRKAEETEENLQSMFKYRLINANAEFYEDSFLGLFWAVLKFKLYNLFKR
jgi:hypothetical protein